MSETTAEPLAPMHGPQHAVPWPTPTIPGTAMVSFWGSGDRTTREFTLPGDASVRIAVETGPLTLRVLRPDGTEGAAAATMPGAGLGLAPIAAGGTYVLEVQAKGAWGVTVVFMTEG